MFDQPFVVMPVECYYCQTKQAVHVADKPCFAHMIERTIPCINCERNFEVSVPNKVIAGPFPVRMATKNSKVYSVKDEAD